MTGPLVFLAILTVHRRLLRIGRCRRRLRSITAHAAGCRRLFAPFGHAPLAALVGIAAVMFGLFSRVVALRERRTRSVAGNGAVAFARDAQSILLR